MRHLVYRHRHLPTILRLLLALALGSLPYAANAICSGRLALQVLGSGGPMVNPGRAGSSYLVWRDGKARLLLDAGSGSLARFGSAGGRIEDLQLIAISHFHVDHAVELPAYIKAGYFIERDRPLPVAGPAGGGRFPGAREFIGALFDAERGAFRYLSGTLKGTEGQFETPVTEVSAANSSATVVLDEPGLRVLAQAVPHGPVPTVAYRIEAGDRVIVYGADQNGDDEAFTAFAKNADLLIMPLAVTGDAEGAAADLHAKPGEVGTIARNSNARQLLLSHIMPRTERDLAAQKTFVQGAYGAPASVAEDLLCVQIDVQDTSEASM